MIIYLHTSTASANAMIPEVAAQEKVVMKLSILTWYFIIVDLDVTCTEFINFGCLKGANLPTQVSLPKSFLY